jgi:tRNA nucleotidyltransferase (CCA-adding enzyme)
MSLGLLDDLSLFPLVFHIPSAVASTLSSPPLSPSLALAAASILHTFNRPNSALFRHPPIHPLILSGLSSSTSVIPRLYMACALTPFRGITYVDEKEKLHPALEAVIREGLKVGTKNHYLDGIPALFSASELFKSPNLEDDRFRSPSERVAIGLCQSRFFVVSRQLRRRRFKVYSSERTLCITLMLAPIGRPRCCSPSFKNS